MQQADIKLDEQNVSVMHKDIKINQTTCGEMKSSLFLNDWSRDNEEVSDDEDTFVTNQ